MELKQLNTFLVIAEQQSFTQAADMLGYAQSTITTQIQLLEEELGTKLFERLGRRISLTSEGRRLLPYAKKMLALSEEARQATADPEEPRGMLTVGTVESLCTTRLPGLLKAYRSRCPEVEISLKFGCSTDFYRMLKENMIDVAFFLDRESPSPEFNSEWMMPEPMVLLALPDHPLTRREQVVPMDLNGESLILTEEGCGYRAAFESILESHGVQPRSKLETGSVQAIKQLVMSGLGITLLPRTAVEEELAQNRLTALRWGGPDFGMKARIVVHKDKWLSASLKAFLSLSKEMLPAVYQSD